MTVNQHLRKNKEFEELVNSEGYQLKSEYVNNKVKVSLLHEECGETFEITPIKFKFRGTRCPCQRNRTSWNTKNFKQAMLTHMGPDFTLLTEYKGLYEKSLVRHESCGNEFYITTRLLITRGKCPYCKSSRGETLVRDILNKLNIDFIEQYRDHNCKYKLKLSFDFYLPEYNTIIEYQGLQHYRYVPSFQSGKVFKEGQIRDDIKRKYCKDNNINLIEIPYNEKNVEREIKTRLNI